jgi:HrpA-like RNA helicase
MEEPQINLGFSDIYTSGSDNLEIWDEKIKRGIFDEDFIYPNPLNEMPWSNDHKQLHTNFTRSLASYQDATAIFDIIRNNQVVLITMGTGAGKTTMIPNIMMHYFAYKNKVAVTIPRRGITESSGIFGARLLDCKLGNEVGYRHGSSKDKATEMTKLLFTTDGTIKAKLTGNDPQLLEYQSVIIDEAHERNVNIDILFSLLVDVCKERPDFKLVVMSATVDPTVFSKFFIKNGLTFKHHHVPVDPKFTIDKIFLEKDITPGIYPAYAQAYLEQILQLTTNGDIMVFFPTLTPAKKIIDEITTPEKLKKYPGKPCFVAYAGTASQEEKNLIIKKDEVTKEPYYKKRGYSRCVILTTPAAESSLTTSGNVVYVIEPGFAKSVWYDPTLFADVSEVTYITKSSIIQRQGRTGRVCNGQAYMLYTKQFYDSLPEYNDPEILKSDLTSDVLSLMNLPITKNLSKTLDFLSNMITPPTVESIESAIKLLYNYAMINSEGLITDLGKATIKLGKYGPEISRMLMVSYYFNCMDDIVLLAAMMCSSGGKGMNDFIKKPRRNDPQEDFDFYNKVMNKFAHPRGDHFTLINILREYLMIHPLDRQKWCNKFKFSYDLFSSSIEQDLESIRNSLQKIDFPQMFTHYPPPKKFEKPPRDLLEYLELHNKKMVEQMIGPQLQQERFQFKYGGSVEDSGSSRASLDSDLSGGFFTNIPKVTRKKMKKQQKNKPKMAKSIKEVINKKFDKIEKEFKINKEPSSRTKDSDKSITLWDTEDIKFISNKTNKLINQVKEDYKSKSNMSMTTSKKLAKISEVDINADDDEDTDPGMIKDEENMFKDDFFKQELQPEIKSKDDLINAFDKNQLLMISLANLKDKLLNKRDSIVIKNKKTKKTMRKKIRNNQHMNKTKKQKGGYEQVEDIHNKMIEREKDKFSKFMNEISLKTETGILPLFRTFENKDENILACIFYGFYMRLGVNYYENKYLVKLSKIDANNMSNTLSFQSIKPSLVIYQNLTIGTMGTDIGIVSELTPRIINAFI